MLLSDAEGGSYLQIAKQRTSRSTIKLKKIKAYTTEGGDGNVVDSTVVDKTSLLTLSTETFRMSHITSFIKHACNACLNSNPTRFRRQWE